MNIRMMPLKYRLDDLERHIDKISREIDDLKQKILEQNWMKWEEENK